MPDQDAGDREVAGLDHRVACHWMMLRLAGTATDDLVAQCRYWLAEERPGEVGRAVTYALLSRHARLSELDLDLLDQLLDDAGADSSALAIVDLADDDELPMCAFVPSRTLVDAALRPDDPDAVAQAARGQHDDWSFERIEDGVEAALATAVAAEAGALGLWRTWRIPVGGSPWPPPKRVFVVEVEESADLVSVTGRLQVVLEAAGEPTPLVEVYPIRARLPSYQHLARAYGAVLWSREPDPGVRIAALFDAAALDAGGHFAPDHPVVAGKELDDLLSYLRQGEPLLVSEVLIDDVVDPTLPESVPTNIVTDGAFVWTDAATYYLERYGLRPDPDLVAHIRHRAYDFPVVDGVGLHRALAALGDLEADSASALG